MSDYTKTTNFTTKDGLSPGDPNKLIKGSDFDTEFDAIATAIATKWDGDNIASQAEAEGETVNTSVLTPLRLGQWADYNCGIVGDAQALTDPNADGLLGWDDSAGAGIFFTMGTGLAFNGTTIEISHLGLEDLTDPDADRLFMWDDSAGISKLMALATEGGLAISATPDLGIDISSLSNSLTGATIAGADLFLVDDGGGGTNKKIAYQDFGIPITNDATTTPMATADLTYANRWFSCNNASPIAFTIPSNAAVAYPVGTMFYIYQAGGGQVTVSVTTDTLRAPNGAKTSVQYSVIYVTKVGTTEWVVGGDTTS